MVNSGVKKSSTVLKALRVLEEIGEHNGGISLSDLAGLIDLDRSTTYRILMTLADAGYLIRSEESKKFRLSYKLLSVSRHLLGNTGFDDLIRDALANLSRKTHEAANFSVLDGDQAVICMQSRGSHLLSADFKIGDRSHLHCTSIGKVLLAQQSEKFIQTFLSRPLPKVASQTITDPNELRLELERVRVAGFAFDVKEFADDMCCVAVPVFGPNGALLGGINFSGPMTRINPKRMDELAQVLLAATNELSLSMRSSPALGRRTADKTPLGVTM